MIFKVLFAFMFPTIAGFLFVIYYFRSYKDGNIFENIMFGYGIGMGFVTLVMFFLGLLHIRFSLSVILIPLVAAICFLSYLIFTSKTAFRDMLFPKYFQGNSTPEKNFSWKKRAVIVFFSAWLLLKFSFVIHEGLILPIHAWDSWVNWSSGAKFFFYEKGLVLDPSDEHFFGWGMRLFLNYPLHDFLIQVWFSLCMGHFDEIYVKFWNVLYFLTTVGILYFSVRRESSVLIAILSAFFLSSAPLFTYHALDAYADLTLGYYNLAAAVCFWRYIEAIERGAPQRNGFLLFMGIFTALTLWTKQEGLLTTLSLSVSVILLHIIKKIPYRNLFFFLMPVAIVAVPWYVFLYSYHIPLFGRGEKFLDSGMHLEIFSSLANQIFLFPNFNIIFVVFIVILLLGYRIIFRSGLKYLLTALFCILSMFIFIYIATKDYKYALDLTGINRNILPLLPMIYYISALTVSRLLQDLTKDKKKIESREADAYLA